MVDHPRELAASAQADGHARGIDRVAFIVGETDLRAERPQAGIGRALVRELVQAGAAARQNDRSAVLAADLGFAPARGICPVGPFPQERRTGYLDALDVGNDEALVARERQARLDDRIQYYAAGIGFVGVRQDFPSL